MLCFHISDWLEHGAGISRTSLDAFVSQHRELQICRDLCLGTKHAIVKNQQRVTEGARLSKESVSVSHGEPARYKWEISYVDRATGTEETIDVRDLARRCFILWQDFLLERDMLRH